MSVAPAVVASPPQRGRSSVLGPGKGWSRGTSRPSHPTQASLLTLAQLGPKEGLASRSEAELTTQDASGEEVPPVVADCSPLTVHEHFDPALAHLGPRAEAHPWLLLGENWLREGQGGARG